MRYLLHLRHHLALRQLHKQPQPHHGEAVPLASVDYLPVQDLGPPLGGQYERGSRIAEACAFTLLARAHWINVGK